MPFYGNSPEQTKSRIRAASYSLSKPVWDEVSDSAQDLILDSDGSSTVTINEFVAAAMHQRLAQRPAALDVAFAAIDTDQSGLLEPDELLALLVKTDPTASLAVLVAEVEAALGTAEALNRIDFEEMMRLPDNTFQGYRSQATSIRLDRALSATLLDLDFASVSQSR